MITSNYEKLQHEHSTLTEHLTKCRADLEQIEKSDTSHKEHVNRNITKIISK
jgi:hypothetical protein